MAQRKINIARMVYQLEFGHNAATDKTNPNTGDSEMEFKPEFTRWAGKWSISQTMALSLAGANIRNAVVFFVRHDSKLTSDYLLRINGDVYTIDNISYDEGRTAKSFDLITCHKQVRKYGK